MELDKRYFEDDGVEEDPETKAEIDNLFRSLIGTHSFRIGLEQFFMI